MTPQIWVLLFKIGLTIAIVGVVAYVAYRNWRTLGRREGEVQAPKRPPKTHVLRISPGVYVTSDGGERHKAWINGWHERAWEWREGDYLEIYLSGERSTRYRITTIHESRASDKWFSLRCEFTPRMSDAQVRAAMGMRQA